MRSGAQFQVVGGEFIRYVFVGGAAFMVDALTLACLVEVAGMHYLVGATLGFVVGALVNYWLSVSWVFSQHSLENRGVELGVFVLIGVGGLGLNDLLMWLFTDRAGLYYLMSKMFAASVVLVYNFALRRALLFTSRQLPGEGTGLRALKKFPGEFFS